MVAAQAVVGRKTNEVPMAAVVLDQIDLEGKIVTADALHTVKATANLIHERGGEFVLPVKENRRALSGALDVLPWRDQLTQPHELRRPAAGQHRSGGRDHRRNRDDGLAERHRLAGDRQRLPRGQHHPRAGPARRQPPGPGPQVSSPERRDRHRRRIHQAPACHLRSQRTCTISSRHAGRHPGFLLRIGGVGC